MSVIYILWLRELRRYVRSRSQLVASLGQPMLYLIALGIGVIAMTVLFSSVFSGIGLLWDRQFGFLKETLVAPVPRIQIMFGRTLGAATVAVIQGILVLVISYIAGFRIANWLMAPLALLFMLMIASLFAALGTTIGSVLTNMQGFQLIMNFLVMPIFFLSGALYPLNNLPKLFAGIISADPLAYGVDALRTVLIGVSHFGLALDAAVLVAVGALFLVIGSHFFSKIQA